MSDNKDQDSDSDTPEEFTQEQAKLEDAALRKIQRQNQTRIAREKKERRKFMADKITPSKSRKIETFEDVEEKEEEKPEENTESLAQKGFLSKDIIDFLAEREKQKTESDSEEEETIEDMPRKKKQKSSGWLWCVQYPPPECLKTGLDFLKMRKAQVPRSSSVIKNSGQALRLATGAALSKKLRHRE